MEGNQKTFKYEFRCGMTCNGCKNAITKLLGQEDCKPTHFWKIIDIISFEPIVEEKKLFVVGPEGIEQNVLDKLSKWVINNLQK